MEQVQCILRECARAWGVSREDITGNSRKQSIVQARFAAAYMMVQSGLTLAETGLELGARDHSTIHYAISVVTARMRYDLEYSQKIERILANCTLTAGSYVPSIGQVTPEQAYQLMKLHLSLLDSMRAQTLHAMSLLPEPPQQDIPSEGLKPTGWINIGAEYVTPEKVDAVGEAMIEAAGRDLDAKLAAEGVEI